MADSLERPKEANERIEVGGPDVYTFRQIAMLAAGATGVRRIRSVPYFSSLPALPSLQPSLLECLGRLQQLLASQQPV